MAAPEDGRHGASNARTRTRTQTDTGVSIVPVHYLSACNNLIEAKSAPIIEDDRACFLLAVSSFVWLRGMSRCLVVWHC